MYQIFKNLFYKNKKNTLSKLLDGNIFLVDVRTPEEFAEGSVKGAVNIPFDTIINNLKIFQNRDHIVVFCKSGFRSNRALNILKHHNISNVTNGGSWTDLKEIVNEINSTKSNEL